MAGSTSAQVRHLRVHTSQGQQKTAQNARKAPRLSAKRAIRSLKSKKNSLLSRSSSNNRMSKTVRYEQYSKYWSILSNFAAVVSVSGALLALARKRRFW